MSGTYPTFPAGLNPYGATPDAHPCQNGWVLLGLSSIGANKATFYHRAWRWAYPDWIVAELPLAERFIHAQLAPIAARLFVYGLTERGYCFEEVRSFVPFAAAAVLSEGEEVMLPPAGALPPRSFTSERDRLWRRHRASL